MNTTLKQLLLAAGALAVAGATLAVAADDGAARKPAEKAKPDAAANADVQKLLDQFSKQRDAMLSDRQKLLDQLKTATEADKKLIMEKLQQQVKDFNETMRELGKLQRDEARKLRENAGRPGGR
jgi:hypothetical protein